MDQPSAAKNGLTLDSTRALYAKADPNLDTDAEKALRRSKPFITPSLGDLALSLSPEAKEI